jgi:hypothetical protein
MVTRLPGVISLVKLAALSRRRRDYRLRAGTHAEGDLANAFVVRIADVQSPAVSNARAVIEAEHG